MKKVAILQSNYIPWKGYFDLINMVDEFVIYDEVQYTKNDWRNRNIIKTSQGKQWLTIPCRQESLYQKISETQTTNKKWNKKHWQTIKTCYAKAKHFKEFEKYFENLYYNSPIDNLSEINIYFLQAINKLLKINTPIKNSANLNLIGDKSEKLVNICMQLKANIYLSGPAAKDYLDIEKFKKNKISVEWMDYSGYPEYQQIHPPFVHGVSILDLLFNVGSQAMTYMKSFENE